jgi:ribosomal protein S18 acetylase RimI-like enzyme
MLAIKTLLEKVEEEEEEDNRIISKPPSTIIRSARMKDTDRIIELLSKLGRPEPRDKQETKHFAKLVQIYIQKKKRKKRMILVAEVDSKVVGMISLVFLPRLNRTTPEAWIPDFIVDQDYRNRGIGKELLEKCISIARKEKCWRIRLETGLSRKHAQRFYKMMEMKPFALALMLSL